ncbi:MAG TPA: glucokinase [Acidobacteriota bacterium]|nr:glucokinase [Acidobacteriota bacterium]
MAKVEEHILVADVGGTNTGVAIIAFSGKDRFEIVRHRTYRSKEVLNFATLYQEFLKKEAGNLRPGVRKACMDFAGPIGPDRSAAVLTNLKRGFTADEVLKATGIEELTLINDFEAVGFGLEILIANRPEAFVRLSRAGRLPPTKGKKPTAAVIGAGTGLGTTVLIHDAVTGKYRPTPGEGGHVDFVAVDEFEFRIAQWIRKNRNISEKNPLNCEKVVSGPGLVNVFYALGDLQPDLARPAIVRQVGDADPYDRPPIIIRNAAKDALCRRVLDIWLRCYGRAAKNAATFPLAPGGVFLAGGIAAKILPEMQSGIFMKEFTRCDVPTVRPLLMRTPVFIVTDYRIGLFGCANVAINFARELGAKKAG